MRFLEWAKDLERRADIAQHGVRLTADERPVQARYPLSADDLVFLRQMDRAFANA